VTRAIASTSDVELVAAVIDADGVPAS